ncbi:uncharacterized protein PAE49_016752 isoform 3-T6 [Odontesthes bonariensis]
MQEVERNGILFNFCQSRREEDNSQTGMSADGPIKPKFPKKGGRFFHQHPQGCNQRVKIQSGKPDSRRTSWKTGISMVNFLRSSEGF